MTRSEQPQTDAEQQNHAQRREHEQPGRTIGLTQRGEQRIQKAAQAAAAGLVGAEQHAAELKHGDRQNNQAEQQQPERDQHLSQHRAMLMSPCVRFHKTLYRGRFTGPRRVIQARLAGRGGSMPRPVSCNEGLPLRSR